MNTVLIANRKGCVGKTMIAVTLASALSAAGARVAIADADPQRSALGWVEARPGAVPRIDGLDWTGAALGRRPRRCDWLILDAPGGRKSGKAERLAAQADAILTPILPAIFDLRATLGFLEDVAAIKRGRKGRLPIHLLVNRVRAGSLAEAALAEGLAGHGIPVLAWISERAACGALAARGLGLFDRAEKAHAPPKAQWRPVLEASGAPA